MFTVIKIESCDLIWKFKLFFQKAKSLPSEYIADEQSIKQKLNLLELKNDGAQNETTVELVNLSLTLLLLPKINAPDLLSLYMGNPGSRMLIAGY